MSRAHKKKTTDLSVYQAAIERINYCYDRFDNIVVNFSGGKDSTVVLNLVIEVATKRNRLPVKAIFFDVEINPPPTIDYMHRINAREDIDLEWYCLPTKHRNACSNEEPYWYAFDPRCPEKWCFQPPDFAILEHPAFKWEMNFQEFSDAMFPVSMGTVCTLTGIRTQESFRRYKAVMMKKEDNYITSKATNKNTYNAHPIYDWSSEDVWVAVRKFGWDYNITYDVYNLTRWHNKFLAQRVAPPFSEEQIRGLWMWAECWPELWHKMVNRVKGVGSAWRYANTELYGFGKQSKPNELSWKEFASLIVDNYESTMKNVVVKGINDIINRHYDKTDQQIPDSDPVHPLTGTSWEFLCKLAIKGDLGKRTAPTLENKAINRQKKLGINSYDDAKRIYGKKPDQLSAASKGVG